MLYVALTRAKNELIITRATDSINAFHHQVDKTSETTEKSAYFLEGLPEHLVKQTSPQTYYSKSTDAPVKNEIDLDLGMDFG